MAEKEPGVLGRIKEKLVESKQKWAREGRLLTGETADYYYRTDTVQAYGPDGYREWLLVKVVLKRIQFSDPGCQRRRTLSLQCGRRRDSPLGQWRTTLSRLRRYLRNPTVVGNCW